MLGLLLINVLLSAYSTVNEMRTRSIVAVRETPSPDTNCPDYQEQDEDADVTLEIMFAHGQGNL